MLPDGLERVQEVLHIAHRSIRIGLDGPQYLSIKHALFASQKPLPHCGPTVMIASWLALTLAGSIEVVRNALLLPRFSNADDRRRQRHKIQIAAGTIWESSFWLVSWSRTARHGGRQSSSRRAEEKRPDPSDLFGRAEAIRSTGRDAATSLDLLGPRNS